MSDKVVPIRPEPEKTYLRGPCICFKCKHEWEGRTEVGYHVVICPECGCEGVYKGVVQCWDSIAWVCTCGCYLYRIDKDGPFCVECGKYATGWFK